MVDLFATDNGPPRSLAEGAALRADLLLGGPTSRTLERLRPEDSLRRFLARAVDRLRAADPDDPLVAELDREALRGATTVVWLSYRPGPDEAGPEKQFDFSRRSLRRRMEAGRRDMSKAMALPAGSPGQQFELRRVRA